MSVAVDQFATSQGSMLSSLTRFDLVAPSDANQLAYVSRAILIGTDGDLAIVRSDGTAFTIPSGTLAPNVWHPMRIVQVKATGTAATNVWVGD